MRLKTGAATTSSGLYDIVAHRMTLNTDDARRIYLTLATGGFVDMDGHSTNEFRAGGFAEFAATLLPDKLRPYADHITRIVRSVFDQDYVVFDSAIEHDFAKDMDAAAEVCVYARLPRGFQIPTPVGDYAPDWAIALNKGAVKHVFFVAETKGTMDTMQLDAIENSKTAHSPRAGDRPKPRQVRAYGWFVRRR